MFKELLAEAVTRADQAMKLALRIIGILVLAVGLFFAVGGILTPFGGDLDLNRSGKVMVGFVYVLFGLVVASVGWALVRRSR